MQSFITLMLSALRSKFLVLYTKVRQMLSLTYWQIFFTRYVLGFFKKLFDVRPKDESDYYTIFRWMISKKLAVAIVVGVGLVCGIYIYGLIPKSAASNPNELSGAPKYRYSDMALSGYNGQVQVIAERNYVAFVGTLADGLASGSGTLYGDDGHVVYTGEFADNKYNGVGNLYYANSDLRYAGDFKDNKFNGKGTLYLEGGIMKYTGDFADNFMHGVGDLYDAVGNRIFTGRFYRDNLVYEQFLGQPTTALGTAFFTHGVVYSDGDKSAVAYPELGVIYTIKDNSNALEGESTVERTYIYGEKFKSGSDELTYRVDLDSYFGAPLYAGDSNVTFGELVAVNEARTVDANSFGSVPTPEFDSQIENVYELTSYDGTAELYITTYEKDGLLYTFYFDVATGPYSAYSIEKASN